jgi:hypothetical protein
VAGPMLAALPVLHLALHWLITVRVAPLLSDPRAPSMKQQDSAFRTAVTPVTLEKCNLWLWIDVRVGIVGRPAGYRHDRRPLRDRQYPPCCPTPSGRGQPAARAGSKCGSRRCHRPITAAATSDALTSVLYSDQYSLQPQDPIFCRSIGGFVPIIVVILAA